MNRVLVIFVALVTVAAAAHAAIEINVDERDTAPTIEGWIGDEATFKGRVRLTAKATTDLFFLASDLKLDGSATLLSRDHVVLDGGDRVHLEPEIPKDVKFSVTGIKEPGTYHGSIEFWQKDQNSTKLPFVVMAKAVPKLTPRKGTETIKLESVNCSAFDCWLAKLILPSGMFIAEYPRSFDNDGLSEISVQAANAAAIGDKGRYPLTDHDLALSLPTKLPRQPVVSLTLKIPREIPPDHYVGDIQLVLTDQPARIKLPLDLSMRTGPGFAAVVLVVGILVGRLVKYMTDTGIPSANVSTGRRLVARVGGVSNGVITPTEFIVLRALVYFVVVIALAWLGLKQFYIENPTFGANALLDYTALAFWAL